MERSISSGELGLLLALRTAGFLAAVPIAGVLADRYSRRFVVRGAAVCAAVASLAIALGLGSVPGLTAGAAALFGVGEGSSRPAFQALVAEVVEPNALQRANAAITLAVRVTVLAGPALAALAVGVAGSAALIACVALLWATAALVLPGSRDQDPVAMAPAVAARDGLHAELAAGLREARRHRWFVAGLGALSIVVVSGYSVTSVVLPLVSRDHYGGGDVLAACITAYTAGAGAGALLMARWRPGNKGWTALAGLALYALAPIALLAAPPAPALVAAYALVGFGIELFNVPWFTATQREVEPRLLARVSSIDFLAAYGLAPIGLALTAPAIVTFGMGPVLVACATACLLAPLAAATTRGARDLSG